MVPWRMPGGRNLSFQQLLAEPWVSSAHLMGDHHLPCWLGAWVSYYKRGGASFIQTSLISPGGKFHKPDPGLGVVVEPKGGRGPLSGVMGSSVGPGWVGHRPWRALQQVAIHRTSPITSASPVPDAPAPLLPLRSWRVALTHRDVLQSARRALWLSHHAAARGLPCHPAPAGSGSAYILISTVQWPRW